MFVCISQLFGNDSDGGVHSFFDAVGAGQSTFRTVDNV